MIAVDDVDAMSARCRELFPALEQAQSHLLQLEGPGAVLSLFMEDGVWRFNLVAKNHWGFLGTYPRESWWFQYPVRGIHEHDGTIANEACLELLLVVASGDCSMDSALGLDESLARLAGGS